MCLKLCVIIHVTKLVSHVSFHVTQTEYATYSLVLGDWLLARSDVACTTLLTLLPSQYGPSCSIYILLRFRDTAAHQNIGTIPLEENVRKCGSRLASSQVMKPSDVQHLFWVNHVFRARVCLGERLNC